MLLPCLFSSSSHLIFISLYISLCVIIYVMTCMLKCHLEMTLTGAQRENRLLV